jgi:excisionase family DNA binding protein
MAQAGTTAPLLDVNEVARRLGTKPRFVRRLIAERRIEFHRVGRHVRISEAALAEFIKLGRSVGDLCPQEGGLMPGKRRFGRVRELPSGRWQARYKGPDGIDRPAPHTFGSKTSAERWLTLTEAEIIQGDWIDPDAGRVLFGKYASDWIEERPGLRPEVYALANTIRGRYRALVLLGVFSSLRWGELAALRRSDIDMQARTVRVSRQLSEKRGGGFVFGPPKSDAGQRLVAIPEVITSDIAAHIVTYAVPDDDGLVFTSPEGRPLRLSNFCRRAWRPALRAAGLPMIHFHDLRHSGNQLAADAGANLRELMDRMGHSTTRAAMAYLHGSDERQQAIADELSRQAAAALGRPKPGRSGTQRARRRGRAS